MPLTKGLKKSLAKGQSTQSGISRWAPLGLILSMTACVSPTAPDIGLPGKPVVGLGVQQQTGIFDAVGQAFTKELGVHSIRVAYGHGDHNFGVNWAAQNGIGVVFFLGYGAGCDVKTAAGRQCYADRSAALAQTYGNKVKYYEIWNEWNGGHGVGSCANKPNTLCTDLVTYTDLLCRTYRAVKAVQPNAIIVGGATSGVDIPWTTKMFDAGAGNCMDAISVHPYVYTPVAHTVPYTSPASVGVDKFIEAITAQHNLGLKKTGRSIPILVTEEGRPDDGTSANQQITADYIAELFRRGPSVPFLVGIWWHDLEDTGTPVDGYGLLRSNNTKKPAFLAFQAAAKSSQRSDRHYQSFIQDW